MVVHTPAVVEEIPVPTQPWPMGVGDVPAPRHDVDEDGKPVSLSIWQVYRQLTPLARRYLLTVARNPDQTPKVAVYNAGSKGRSAATLKETVKRWRETYIGFSELEDKLFNEPITAAHFIAVVKLPKALAHFGDVLEGAKGSKSQAALHIVNVANFEGRTQAKKQTSPVDPNEEKTSTRLESYIAGQS